MERNRQKEVENEKEGKKENSFLLQKRKKNERKRSPFYINMETVEIMAKKIWSWVNI